MTNKILFFLNADSFHAHLWKNGKMEAPYYFTSAGDGPQRLARFLREHKCPAYLLVDLIEEDFRQETIPHLTGSNHQALLLRKFEQYYRNTPFRLASFQFRQDEGRRDDEMLFSALTNANRISPWLDILMQLQVPLAGIYSVPHTCSPLIKDIDSDHLLLLTWEKDAGLRQTYFFNKRLRFSRLTPINADRTFAEVIANESALTQQYLRSLSLTPQGQSLNVYIVCHADDRSRLDEYLASNNQMQYAYLDIAQLSKQYKCQYPHTDSDATPLLMSLLASHPPKANYATAPHMHFYQLWQARRGMYGLSAVLAIVSVLWSIFSVFSGSAMNTEIDNIHNQVGNLNREIRQVSMQLPDSIQGQNGKNVSASDMKTAVTLMQALQPYSASMQQLLQGLGTTLNAFPQVNTNKIDWKISANGQPGAEINYAGELLAFGNNYREALDYFDRFQKTLTQSGYIVTPVSLPLDFSSKSSINDDIKLVGTEKPYAFSLKLAWRSMP